MQICLQSSISTCFIVQIPIVLHLPSAPSFLNIIHQSYLTISLPFNYIFNQAMRPRYIIQVDPHAPYPFDGAKQNCASVHVRITYHCMSSAEQTLLLTQLSCLVKLDYQHVVRILEVQEIKGKSITVTYQYVPECLKNSHKVTQIYQLNQIKQKCIEVYHYFAKNKIKSNFVLQNIGFDSQGQLKIFMPFNFQIVSEEQVQTISLQLQNQIEKTFQQQFSSVYSLSAVVDNKSQYSQRLSKQIAKIQEKLKSRNRHMKNGNSPDKSNDSRLEKSKSKSSKQSHNSMTGPPSNSIIQLSKYQGKIHKSSFGDYTTTSHRLNEQQAVESNLKARVHNAHEKTRQVFKIYEKYSKHKG